MVSNTPRNNPGPILVTGANGLLGQKLIKRLLEQQQYEIIATGRGACRLPESWKGYTYASMDITDESAVMEVFGKYAPKLVIHGAAMTNVDQCETEREDCYAQNVRAVSHILNGCEAQGAYLVHVSTDFIFDGAEGPYDEQAVPNPINYYGETKLQAEKLILDSRVKAGIARTVLVYGISHDMSRSNIVLWVKDSIEKGKTLQLVDDQLRTPTLAEDLAEGCLLMAANQAEGIYNISGEEVLTPYEMAMQTVDFFKLDKTKITKTDSTAFQQTAKRPLKTGFIIQKAKDQLNYKPKSFKKGIEILAKQLNLAN
ncbi:NAD(P)-dependent oxidoreductase [Echinicola pacifica]|uniref:dTDP-4-dehydrorhamnose reductase n=1 Tax=Echinicola pacifica TaxID=346377 RepID=A0A918Q6W9_9BACT|nr:SDR family oxidoreductase [Echinicola pacifica]GGZ33940.1 NAD(P)-dependent oxidoreductase [Echinicola pacifica]